MNTYQNKIQNTSRLVCFFLMLMMLFMLAFIVAQTIAVLIFYAGNPEASTFYYTVQYFFQNSHASEELMAVMLCANLFAKCTVFLILYITYKVFKDMSTEYTPFSEKHNKRFKAIAWLMVAQFALTPLIQGTLAYILKLNENLSVQCDFIDLVPVVIFYALAQIFEYGRMLQQEADETI